MNADRLRTALFASLATFLLLPADSGLSQPLNGPSAETPSSAVSIADFFGEIGDRIYEKDCIFELSEEQLEVQQGLIEAYVNQGASSALARQLATKQIALPALSDECEQMRGQSQSVPQITWAPPIVTNPKIETAPPKRAPPPAVAPKMTLAEKKVLPQWDCAPGVDYVTIRHNGYERKLTGGEICSPFNDVVRGVPESLKSFRLGYAITTGRVFVIADDPGVNGRTIAWAISGREVCRNNPDPDCLATRAVGPLPPGEYSFSSDREQRISWGPKSKRMVAGIYLAKLWYRERFTPAQTAAILARGNIAIHVRLKGEMSEACLGLEPNGWAYVSSLIKEGRATGVNVYIEEPYPQIAENPPIVTASSFSLSSLFK